MNHIIAYDRGIYIIVDYAVYIKVKNIVKQM